MPQRHFLERKRLSLDGNKVLVKLVAPLLTGWASQGHILPFMGSQLSPFVKREHWISKASLTLVFLDFAVSQTLLWKKQEKVQLRFVVKEARLILTCISLWSPIMSGETKLQTNIGCLVFCWEKKKEGIKRVTQRNWMRMTDDVKKVEKDWK